MKAEQKYNLKIKDKNGKDIYHLDKVSYADYVGTVTYNIDSCRFEIKWDDGETRTMNSIFAKEVEVLD